MNEAKPQKSSLVEDYRRYAELALRHTLDAVLVTDIENNVVWINSGFERMFGHRLETIIGRAAQGLLDGPDTDPEARETLMQAIKARQTVTVDILHYKLDGAQIWCDKTLTPIYDEHGKHTHFMSIARDITNRREMEEKTNQVMANEEQRQHERRLLSQVSEWLYSAKSLEELLMVVQKSMHTLIPEAEGQLYIYSNTRDALDLKTHWGDEPPHQHIDAEDCWALRRGRAYSYGIKAIEFPCSHVEGEDTPFFCLPIIAHGETIGLLHLSFSAFDRSLMTREMIETFIGQRWDLGLLCAEQISLAVANVQLRQELLDQSVRDPLTSLWNRRWFIDAAQRELKRSERAKQPMSLISLDVDHFKKFNDNHGHDAGDMVLREVGALLRQTFNQTLAPCRLGGEEFVVLCPGLSTEEAVEIANTFRLALSSREIAYGDGHLPRISVSAGVATFPEDGRRVDDLLKNADLALYRAKDQGRNQVVSVAELSGRIAAQ
ncbi:MAG: diguanylate cyclase [Planctomycetota bacterium]